MPQNDPPKVSVVTPTYNRPELLRKAYDVFAAQTYAEREWIVIDDSDAPHPFFQQLQDPKVTYIYLDERQSTGAKRNLGIERSSGAIIAQFDDDDFYRPDYLEAMVTLMERNQADLIKFSAFFVYHVEGRKLAYCDLMDKRSEVYEIAPDGPVRHVRLMAGGDRRDNHLGYGFCYLFRRSVWERDPFEDRFWGQDTPFVKRAAANGFKVVLLPDKQGLSLHVIHSRNESKTFAHYLLPEFMLQAFFPGATRYLGSAN